MAAPIEIHTRADVDLSGALVIVGAPGLGFVGSIMTRYLVEALEMERIGGLHCAEFPPYTPIEKGRPLHPVRIHALETRCGLDLKCDRIVALTSELFAGTHMIHHLSETIVDWASGIDAELMIVPDAIMPADEAEESEKIHGIASTDQAAAFLERADVPSLNEGVMMGMTAGLLAASEHQEFDTVALLAESKPDHPDARAAARLVELMDVILPGIKLESGPLLERAEGIEATVKSLRLQLARQTKQVATDMPTEEARVSMYH